MSLENRRINGVIFIVSNITFKGFLRR